MSLLSAIVVMTGHEQISDLRPEFASTSEKRQMKRIINSIPHENYSEKEWNDALHYLGLIP